MTTKSFFQSGSYLKQGMLAVTILLSSISFTACSDDDDKNQPEPEAKAKEVKFEAQSFTEWTYFSFAKGEIVKVDQENYATDSNWDIAFLRYYIRTNGGKSGKGQGAALDTKQTKFDAVTTIPSTGFITDDNISIITGSGMPPKYRTDAGSPAFTIKESQSWATYTPPMGPWVYNNNVFIVRTADGQYAKLIMKSFLNDEDKSGNITFEYIYPFK